MTVSAIVVVGRRRGARSERLTVKSALSFAFILQQSKTSKFVEHVYVRCVIHRQIDGPSKSASAEMGPMALMFSRASL